MTATTASIFVVDLACLACGRERQLTVAALADLPLMPERCTVCNGSVLAVGSTSRVVRNAGLIDWRADRPRRGRPLAHPQPTIFQREFPMTEEKAWI
jgi:hypothetical protein